MDRYHEFPVSFAMHERRSWQGLAVCMVASACLVAVALMYLRMHALVEDMEIALQEKRALAARAIVSRRPSPAQLEVRMRELKFVKVIDASLAMPWDDLLREFEAHSGPDITLLSMEPDLPARTVAVTAEARNLSTMLDYAELFGTSARFGDVFIKQHEVQATDPKKPVRFVLSLGWLMRPQTGGLQP